MKTKLTTLVAAVLLAGGLHAQQVSINPYKVSWSNCRWADEHRWAGEAVTHWTDTTCSSVRIHGFRLGMKDTTAAAHLNEHLENEFMALWPAMKPRPTVHGLQDKLDALPHGQFMEVYYHQEFLLLEYPMLSYSMAVEAYTGDPHPMHYASLSVMDLRNGDPVTLDDVLRPGFEKALREIGEKYFRATYHWDDWSFPKNRFYLPEEVAFTDYGLLFLYNEHEIGDWTQGKVTLRIPYSAVKDWIAEGGMLAKYR